MCLYTSFPRSSCRSRQCAYARRQISTPSYPRPSASASEASQSEACKCICKVPINFSSYCSVFILGCPPLAARIARDVLSFSLRCERSSRIPCSGRRTTCRTCDCFLAVALRRDGGPNTLGPEREANGSPQSLPCATLRLAAAGSYVVRSIPFLFPSYRGISTGFATLSCSIISSAWMALLTASLNSL